MVDQAIQAEKEYFGVSPRPGVTKDPEEQPFQDDVARLSNCRHEQFAQHLVRGLNGRKAYIAAGYTGKSAKQSASRLRIHPAVAARVRELLSERSAAAIEAVVARKISTSNPAWAEELQAEWDEVRETLDGIRLERGADLANETPGGATGFLSKSYQCGQPVYRVDVGLLKLLGRLRRLQRRAAEEVADWATHYECSVIDRTEGKSEEEIYLALLADVTAKISARNECLEFRGENQALSVDMSVCGPAEPCLQPEASPEAASVPVVGVRPVCLLPASRKKYYARRRQRGKSPQRGSGRKRRYQAHLARAHGKRTRGPPRTGARSLA
jgi:hypothetical protein